MMVQLPVIDVGLFPEVRDPTPKPLVSVIGHETMVSATIVP